MGSYTEKDIQVLEGLEPVRQKPGMFVGTTDSNGVMQIVKEAVDNCVDEYLIGENNVVFIDIDVENNIVTVADKGRGIPVGKHKKTKISTLTTVMTYLHSGGKFTGKEISIGVHGVGISCSNALSSEFEVWTRREGKWWYQRFEEGKASTKVIKKKPPKLNGKWKRGTIIRFRPDPTIFKSQAKIPVRKIREWLEDLVYLCPNLTIHFIAGGKASKFHSSEGLREYMKVVSGKASRIGKPFVYTSKDGNVDVAMQWTDGDESLYTFVNCSNTQDDGTHFAGFRKALNEGIGSISGDGKYNKEDLRAGLIGMLHLKMPNPNFHSQTKDKLIDRHAEALVYDELLPAFRKFFSANKHLADRIVSNAVKLTHAREKFKKDISAIKKIKIESSNKRGILPDVLMEATTKDPKARELYIVEGGSASGTVKQARDKVTQEVLELSGKFSNTARQKMGAVLGNVNVMNVITAIGANILEKCNPDKARVGKIIFLSDADSDGRHINCLLATLITMYMPDLIKSGMVYSVDSPLFIAEWKSKKYFGNSLSEITKQVGKKANPIITRLKGWGQLNYKDMADIAMNVKTRKLFKLKINEVQTEVVEEIMGSDVAARKKLLGLGG